MRRKWISFDQATTDPEFRAIPERDVSDLFTAMGQWAKGLEGGFVVKSYSGGLLMIKSANRTSGRCLFFTLDDQDPTLAVALLGYKKESNEAPSRLVATARERMARYLDKRRT